MFGVHLASLDELLVVAQNFGNLRLKDQLDPVLGEPCNMKVVEIHQLLKLMSWVSNKGPLTVMDGGYIQSN